MELLATCPHKHYSNRTVSYLSTQILHQLNCYLPVHTNTTPWNCYLPIHTNTTPMELRATCPHNNYINGTVSYLSTQTLHQWNCQLPVHTNTTPIKLLATCPHKYYTMELSSNSPHKHNSNRTVIYLSTQTLHHGSVSYLSTQIQYQWNCYLPVHTNATPWNSYLPIHTNTTPMELLATYPHKHYTNETVSNLSTQTLHQ